MQTVTTEKVPIYLWLDDLDTDTLQQLQNLANLPCAFKHVAAMPDSHLGYGMPIGGVFASKGAVIPNAVGVDIGCGMLAAKTSITGVVDKDTLKLVMGRVRDAIPVGFNHHKSKQQDDLFDTYVHPFEGSVVTAELENAKSQLGTLGGGNHFIEFQHGSDGHLWVMIHSGSRNLGFKVAKHYNQIAVDRNEKLPVNEQTPQKWELASLPVETEEAQHYLAEMHFCVQFAYVNRMHMMRQIMQVLLEIFAEFQVLNTINIAHNYVAPEVHFGERVWVHRKGATLADEGVVGIIPGSQGTKSYIVAGKGCQDSFNSCSHGAGRRLGRKEAQRSLDLATEIQLLNDAGVIHSIRNKSDLDESTGAYKSIADVMKNQQDLVDILVELTPLGVIKG